MEKYKVYFKNSSPLVEANCNIIPFSAHITMTDSEARCTGQIFPTIKSDTAGVEGVKSWVNPEKEEGGQDYFKILRSQIDVKSFLCKTETEHVGSGTSTSLSCADKEIKIRQKLMANCMMNRKVDHLLNNWQSIGIREPDISGGTWTPWGAKEYIYTDGNVEDAQCLYASTDPAKVQLSNTIQSNILSSSEARASHLLQGDSKWKSFWDGMGSDAVFFHMVDAVKGQQSITAIFRTLFAPDHLQSLKDMQKGTSSALTTVALNGHLPAFCSGDSRKKDRLTFLLEKGTVLDQINGRTLAFTIGLAEEGYGGLYFGILMDTYSKNRTPQALSTFSACRILSVRKLCCMYLSRILQELTSCQIVLHMPDIGKACSDFKGSSNLPDIVASVNSLSASWAVVIPNTAGQPIHEASLKRSIIGRNQESSDVSVGTTSPSSLVLRTSGKRSIKGRYHESANVVGIIIAGSQVLQASGNRLAKGRSQKSGNGSSRILSAVDNQGHGASGNKPVNGRGQKSGNGSSGILSAVDSPALKASGNRPVKRRSQQSGNGSSGNLRAVDSQRLGALGNRPVKGRLKQFGNGSSEMVSAVDNRVLRPSGNRPVKGRSQKLGNGSDGISNAVDSHALQASGNKAVKGRCKNSGNVSSEMSSTVDSQGLEASEKGQVKEGSKKSGKGTSGIFSVDSRALQASGNRPVEGKRQKCGNVSCGMLNTVDRQVFGASGNGNVKGRSQILGTGSSGISGSVDSQLLEASGNRPVKGRSQTSRNGPSGISSSLDTRVLQVSGNRSIKGRSLESLDGSVGIPSADSPVLKAFRNTPRCGMLGLASVTAPCMSSHFKEAAFKRNSEERNSRRGISTSRFMGRFAPETPQRCCSKHQCIHRSNVTAVPVEEQYKSLQKQKMDRQETLAGPFSGVKRYDKLFNIISVLGHLLLSFVLLYHLSYFWKEMHAADIFVATMFVTIFTELIAGGLPLSKSLSDRIKTVFIIKLNVPYKKRKQSWLSDCLTSCHLYDLWKHIVDTGQFYRAQFVAPLIGVSPHNCPDEDLDCWMCRAATFDDCEEELRINPVQCAISGFFYSRHDNAIRCFYCQASCLDWNYHVDPPQLHRRISNWCSFYMHSIDASGICPDHPDNRRHGRMRDERLMWCGSCRRISFMDCPTPINISCDGLAYCGFFYKHSSHTIRCYMCQEECFNFTAFDDPVKLHHRVSPNCLWNLLQMGLELWELDEFEKGMACFCCRLKSFAHCMSTFKCSPFSMASAGFYYRKVSNSVRCYMCKKEVFSWNNGDDPVTMHGRVCASCPLMVSLHPAWESPKVAVPAEKEGAVSSTSALDCQPSEQTPKHPQFKDVRDRIKSFEESASVLATNRELIKGLTENGLFLSSSGTIRCYVCNGELPDDEIYPGNCHHDTCVFKNQGRQYGDSKSNQQSETVPDPRAKVTVRSENGRLRQTLYCNGCSVKPVDVVFRPCGCLKFCHTCASQLRICTCGKKIKGISPAKI